MDAPTAAIVAGSLGAAIAGFATIGAQLATHVGTNRREQRERLYESLSGVYVQAYSAIRDVVYEVNSGERSDPSPWARLDALSDQIEFLGNAALGFEITMLITDATEMVEVKESFPEESDEVEEANAQLHKQVGLLRDLMRKDLGLPPEGDVTQAAKRTLRRRYEISWWRRLIQFSERNVNRGDDE